MQFIKELLPTHLEKVKMAEVEPGFILMVLIWLFSSFFSKKKSKTAKPSINKEKVSQKLKSLLRKLGDLPEIDVNEPQNLFSDSNNVFFDEEPMEPELDFDTIQEENSYDVDADSTIAEAEDLDYIIASNSSHKEIKLYGTPLQKVMVLKEILGKPRALNPFTFEDYNYFLLFI